MDQLIADRLQDNTTSTFLSSAMTWNKYGLCAFDCGPVLWSKSGFVDFSRVAQRMKQIGWPYEGTAREVLRPLYHIAEDYRRPPMRAISRWVRGSRRTTWLTSGSVN
jgi:hypothetical protein